MKNLYRFWLVAFGLAAFLTFPGSLHAQIFRPAPTCSIKAERSSYMVGETIILYWTSQDGTYAEFQKGSPVGNSLKLPEERLAAAGSQTLIAEAAGNPTINLTVSGVGGSTSCSLAIPISEKVPAPNVTIGALPSALQLGQSAKVYWNTQNAQRCVLRYDLKEEFVEPTGYRMMSPIQTTTYDLWCANGESEASPATSQFANVYVSSKSPNCSLYTDKTSYNVGDRITLNWTSDNASYAIFEQATGLRSFLNLPADKQKVQDTYETGALQPGSAKVSLTAHNAIGSATCSVTVFIKGPGAAKMSAAAASNGSACAALNNALRLRSKDAETGNEVSLLQKFLQAKNYLNSEPTGFFGQLTESAVKKFQADNGLEAVGSVGPMTRAKIKALTCP